MRDTIIALARTLTDHDWVGVELTEGKCSYIASERVFETEECQALLDYVRELAEGLFAFEREMIRGELDGEWGAAIGVAVEGLRGRGLYAGFSRTPLARAVRRVLESE